MLTRDQVREAAAMLLDKIILSEDELNGRFQNAIDVEYWRELVPNLNLEGAQDRERYEDSIISAHHETMASTHLAAHGYFHMPPVLGTPFIEKMGSCVERLRVAGWPAVFSFVYDEFWGILRTPILTRFLTRHLGARYVQTANIWIWRVDPQRRGSGWPPHVDSRDDAKRLTIWIPLTEANVANGCIYVIPQDHVPASLPSCFRDWTSISRKELETILHGVRPLPALPGSVLGWSNRVIHWGGHALDASAGPRISIGAEFLHEATEPADSERPLSGAHVPSLPVRLRAIGQVILAYQNFEPLVHRYCKLAQKLIDWAGYDRPCTLIQSKESRRGHLDGPALAGG
jgi:hypothetical protein